MMKYNTLYEQNVTVLRIVKTALLLKHKINSIKIFQTAKF